jgi:hypothetical protein
MPERPEVGEPQAPPALEPTEHGQEPSEKRRLQWNQPEFAWPLAIVAGIAGTWIGLLSGVPGLATLLATAGFAPLWIRLLAREERWLAGLCSLAWMVAMAFTVIGVSLESSAGSVRDLIPFSDPELLGGLGLGAEAPAGMSRSERFAWQLAGLVVLVLLAFPTRGLWCLFAVALVVDALSGAASGFAEGLRAASERLGEDVEPLSAALGGWPPGPFLALCGALLAGAAFAGPAPPLPLERLSDARRSLLITGVSLGVAALFFEPLYAPLWRACFGD